MGTKKEYQLYFITIYFFEILVKFIDRLDIENYNKILYIYYTSVKFLPIPNRLFWVQILKNLSSGAQGMRGSPINRLECQNFFQFKICILGWKYAILQHSGKSFYSAQRHAMVVDRLTIGSEIFLVEKKSFWEPNMHFNEFLKNRPCEA